MKLELSINVNYLPGWGSWEGIRELVQNGKDAELQLDAPLKITHYEQTLRIENEGAVLPHEALLMGTTSKADRQDTIGKFGEGLKLGILALLRAGRPVKIRSGSEVWVPTIARSEKFKADVLVVDIKDGREPRQRVRVEIGGVTSVEWESVRDRFLFVSKPSDDERVTTGYGDLLLSERFRGAIYVKGIWVATKPELGYGYNFPDARVDRDRKMVDEYDAQYARAAIWREAVARRPDMLDPFFKLAENIESPDLKGLSVYTDITADVLGEATRRFQAQFGSDAFPVATMADSQDIAHLGMRGVVVNPVMGALLQKAMGTLDQAKMRLREEVVKTYAWGDLTQDEQGNLSSAIELVQLAHPACSLGHIDVVDFRSDTFNGQFKDKRVLLAKCILSDPDQTLATLLHEEAHNFGIDGEKGHVAAIERMWRTIVKSLRRA